MKSINLTLSRLTRAAVTGGCICAALAFTAPSLALEKLKATEKQSQTVVEIIDKLAERHYHSQEIDDQLSSRFFEEFLNTLDPNKIYFTEGDIADYDAYRLVFDDQLKKGRLAVSFELFNDYRVKAERRLQRIVEQLEDPDYRFDYGKAETVTLDRSEASWVDSSKELDELWRKRVKASALSLKLAGKDKAEIRTLLIKRFNNQLKRINQQNGSDAFEIIVNTLTLLHDPHTNYLSPRTLENFNISMSLKLEGIGAVLQTEDEYTKVVRLVAAGPADKQGELKPAHKITAVGQGSDGEMVNVIGWRIDEVVQLIRGDKDTLVRLEVLSGDSAGNSKIIKINRGTVKLEEQAAQKAVMELTDGEDVFKLGVINVPAFYLDFAAYRKRDPNFRSTTRDVLRLLKELREEGVDGIVLDLRNNGGGSLQEATTLTDLFIDPGLVVQIRHANQTITRHHRSRTQAVYRGPLLVLINRLSASASEIFAGAIQDYQRGLVVGAQSFGKGTVQSLTPLQEGQLKITESKFYRVSGESTQHRGVIPDIALPSMINADQVGERSYDNALAWDKIHSVIYNKYFNLPALLPALKEMHQQRIEKDPDFVFMHDQLQLLESMRDINQLSLLEKQRIKEKAQLNSKELAIENRRRLAKGLDAYTSIEEMNGVPEDKDEQVAAAATQTQQNKIEPDKDPLLTESGYILIDFINQLKSQQASKVANF